MKNLILLAISLFFPLVIFSQDSGLGFRAGYNYATSSISEIFVGKDSITPAPDPSGFTGTFLLDLGITNIFSIETNFQFSENETGITIDSLMNGNVSENGIITTRFDFPVLGKIRIGSEIFKLNVFAGPDFSFQQTKFDEERIYEVDSKEPEITRTEIEKSSFKSYDYRNLAGFGFSIHLNQFVLFGDYRYIFDFNNLNTIRQTGLVENLGSNIGVGVGYYW